MFKYKDEDLGTKTMQELILLTEECLIERDEYNKTALGFNKLTDRNDSKVKEFFKLLNETKKCVDENRFTDGFESAMKLKLFLSTSSIFNVFIGDTELAPLFSCMVRLITSKFFDVLESIENKLKLEQNFTITKLLQ